MIVVIKAQVPIVTFLPILTTGVEKEAYMSKFVGKREGDFVCIVVLVFHKVL